jgi:hypothetical protein
MAVVARGIPGIGRTVQTKKAGTRRSPPLGFDGADEGTRTPDPRITSAVLYQLSYVGVPYSRLQ